MLQTRIIRYRIWFLIGLRKHRKGSSKVAEKIIGQGQKKSPYQQHIIEYAHLLHILVYGANFRKRTIRKDAEKFPGDAAKGERELLGGVGHCHIFKEMARLRNKRSKGF